MFTPAGFLEIMGESFDKYKKLLELLELQLPQDFDNFKERYVEGDENSPNKLLQDYREFDKELEKRICKKLKSEKFKSGCCNLLKVAHIDYNSFDMPDVLSKIVKNREKIKKDVLELSKRK